MSEALDDVRRSSDAIVIDKLLDLESALMNVRCTSRCCFDGGSCCSL